MISLRAISFFHRSEKFLVLTDQLLVSGVTFLTTVMAARSLPVAVFGWFSSVLLVQLLILAVQNALITGPYQVLQPSYQPGERRGYQDSLFILQLLLVAGLLPVSWAIFYFPGVRESPLWPARWWILLATAGFLLQDFLRRVLLAGGAAGKALLIDTVTNGLQLGILMWFFSRQALDLTTALAVMGLTYIPSVILGYRLLAIRVVVIPHILLTGRQHFFHGKWLALTALLQWWAGNIFMVAAGLLSGIAAFGALRLAQSIFGVLNVLLQAFENYVLPRSAFLHQSSPGSLQKYLRNISIRGGLIFIPVLAGMALFSRTILRVAGGPSYESYYAVIPWLSVLYFFIFIGYPIRIAIRVLLLNRAIFIAYLVSAVFSGLAARRFVEWWGVEGVTTGLILNQWLILSYWLFILQKKKLLLWK